MADADEKPKWKYIGDIQCSTDDDPEHHIDLTEVDHAQIQVKVNESGEKLICLRLEDCAETWARIEFKWKDLFEVILDK